MKKILSLALAVIMCLGVVLSFASCGAKSDWELVQEKGYFVCGITLYEPMNFTDADGNLTGFDTELATLVAEKLGVEAKFQLISWGNKYVELTSGAIDCIWNGFTSNCADSDGQQRADKVDFTYAYLDNAQCVVINSARAAEFTSAESLAGKKAAVETGSAGESYAKSVNAEIVGKTSQKDTFTELKSGAVDFIVVDVLLANELAGKGDFSALTKANITIEKEEYSIGCRKNSDLDAKINEALVSLLNEGKLEALATKYGVTVTESLLAKKAAQ